MAAAGTASLAALRTRSALVTDPSHSSAIVSVPPGRRRGSRVLAGWHTKQAYTDFCQVYGFDLTTWAGFPVIRAIDELKMTTWLMQNVRHDQRVAHEFRIRLASLHDSTTPRSWRPF